MPLNILKREADKNMAETWAANICQLVTKALSNFELQI